MISDRNRKSKIFSSTFKCPRSINWLEKQESMRWADKILKNWRMCLFRLRNASQCDFLAWNFVKLLVRKLECPTCFNLAKFYFSFEKKWLSLKIQLKNCFLNRYLVLRIYKNCSFWTLIFICNSIRSFLLESSAALQEQLNQNVSCHIF